MSRYIDADAYEQKMNDYYPKFWKTVLNEQPSIDIVFCEECRECVEKGTGIDCPSGYGYLYCTRKKSVVDEDDYCSWGERK